MWILLIIIWVCCAMISRMIVSNRTDSSKVMTNYAIFGFLLGPLGVLLAITYKPKPGEEIGAVPVHASSKSIDDQITNLAALHSAGSLSDEEFAAAKARLFGA